MPPLAVSLRICSLNPCNVQQACLQRTLIGNGCQQWGELCWCQPPSLEDIQVECVSLPQVACTGGLKTSRSTQTMSPMQTGTHRKHLQLLLALGQGTFSPRQPLLLHWH